jgi:Flp pilus assembly protein TadG
MKWKRLSIRDHKTTPRPLRSLRRKHAQSSVEFALVVPIAITLIFGIMQFGHILYIQSFVVYAARSAARYGMMNSSLTPQPATSASITTFVKGLTAGIDQTKLSVTSTWIPTSTPGSLVKVQVSYTYKPFAPYLPSANINLSSTTQMTIVY